MYSYKRNILKIIIISVWLFLNQTNTTVWNQWWALTVWWTFHKIMGFTLWPTKFNPICNNANCFTKQTAFNSCASKRLHPQIHLCLWFWQMYVLNILNEKEGFSKCRSSVRVLNPCVDKGGKTFSSSGSKQVKQYYLRCWSFILQVLAYMNTHSYHCLFIRQKKITFSFVLSSSNPLDDLEGPFLYRL